MKIFDNVEIYNIDKNNERSAVNIKYVSGEVAKLIGEVIPPDWNALSGDVTEILNKPNISGMIATAIDELKEDIGTALDAINGEGI